MEQKKSKTTIIAGIIITIAIIISIATVVYLQTAGKESKITKTIELADQYLKDLEYEQAIALYEEVLSIDPVNKEALTGGSKAYAGLAGTQNSFDTALENLDQAIALAQKAYETYAEETEVQSVLLDAYTQAGTVCADAEKYEEAIDYYEAAVELNVDDNLKEKQEEIQEKIEELQKLLEEQKQKKEEETRNKAYEELLKPVLEAWQGGDMETVKTLIRQDTYNDMAATLKDGESYYYGEYDKDGERSGIGCGVYIVEDYYDGEIPMYYLGEWKDGKRDGHANWIYSDISMGINYECNWVNDFPEGDVTCEYDYAPGELEDGILVSTKGNVTRGLYNTLSEFWSDSDEIWHSSYSNGYIEMIMDTVPAGYYCIAGTIEGSEDPYSDNYWYMNEEQMNLQYGLPGFGETSL